MNATGLEQDEKKTKRNSVPLAWLGKIDQNSAKPSNRLKTPPDQAENSVKTRYTTRGPRRRPLERPDARPPSWQKSVEKLGNARRLKVTPRRSDGDWGGGARRRRRQVKRHLAPHGPVPFFLSFHFSPPLSLSFVSLFVRSFVIVVVVVVLRLALPGPLSATHLFWAPTKHVTGFRYRVFV